MFTISLPATLDIPVGADPRPHTVPASHTFGPCTWCDYEPAQPASITTMWDRRDATTDGHEDHCPACAPKVFAHALLDCHPEGITVEYPVTHEPAVAA